MANEEKVFLGAYWMGRGLTGREFITRCYNFLAGLIDFSRAFEHRCVAVKEGNTIVPAALPKTYQAFEQLMIRVVPDNDQVYVNPDPTNKNFTLESTTPAGFTISFSDAGNGATPPTRLSVSITAGVHGEYQTPNSVLINIPPEYRVFWEDKQRARELVQLVVATWKPTIAALTSRELRQALDTKRENDLPLGPLTYFSDKEVGTVADETASVDASSEGGVLLIIDAPYPWTASLHHFRSCYTRLSEAGLLQWAYRRQPRAS
jgi:hypothetical protein